MYISSLNSFDFNGESEGGEQMAVIMTQGDVIELNYGSLAGFN